MASLRIGMFGGGTVGGGVYEILQSRRAFFQSIGADVVVKTICVRNLEKQRDFTIGNETRVVSSYDDILNDPSINVVLELMGGVTDAKDVVMRALRGGKHVVTANKALVAACMEELETVLKENPSVSLGFEAAVCGGIPIIHTLGSAYTGDVINQVAGIMNGTTNFMLSKMESEGADYGDVLKEAQDLGFAEADPTADVEGLDVQSKLSILTKMAFHVTLPPTEIPTAGISQLSSADFEYASKMGATIKLLGIAKRNSPSDPLSVFVSPAIVPRDNVIASVAGATNIVNVTSQNLASSSYVGQGAGRYPTANSVVSDVIMLARNLLPPAFPNDVQVAIEPDYEAQFYIRLVVKDQVGIIKAVGQACEDAGCSIYSVLQTPIVDPNNVNFVVTTERARRSQVQAVSDAVGAMDFCHCAPVVLPFL